MAYDFAQERHEASLADEIDDLRYEAEQDARDDEDRYERRQSLYRCTDRMCGALDCSRCYPASFDAVCEEEHHADQE